MKVPPLSKALSDGKYSFIAQVLTFRQASSYTLKVYKLVIQ